MAQFFAFSSQFWVVEVVLFSMLQTGFVSMKLNSPCQYILWILAVEIACPSWGESD
jgi:hypothetical protein